jgi:hypothetical protein
LAPASAEPSIPIDLSDDERLRFVEELARAAQTGDLDAVAALRQCFEEYPTLWEGVGNLARQAEYSVIRLAANGNPVVADALLQKLANLKVDLRWSSGTGLEELLIDRIALTWLQLAYLDVMCAQRGACLSAFAVEQLERRQDRAQRRFLAAIRAAAVVRRLLAPSVEVSVTARQII